MPQEPYRIILCPFVPGVVLVCCQRIVTACPDAEDALWAAACHAARGWADMATLAALHLVHRWWIASCPECGHELGRSRDQEAAERAGERRRCPICQPQRPDRHAQLAFLVAWLTTNSLDQEEAS